MELQIGAARTKADVVMIIGALVSGVVLLGTLLFGQWSFVTGLLTGLGCAIGAVGLADGVARPR
jgi:hypothetical protein